MSTIEAKKSRKRSHEALKKLKDWWNSRKYRPEKNYMKKKPPERLD